ncbi:MAG: hypothetical protein JEY91_10465 [Spirochaetaceae bacterium]|nr:hypothetical protein [Spirochaetaceae bacterium]
MESLFYRGIKKIKKNFYSGATADVESDIKELLYKNMDVDESVCDDLYFRYCGNSENIFDSAETLSDIVDLFNGEYDEVNDPLKEEDWIYIRNIVDASAEELNLEIITYIMRLIVDKGFI